MSTSSKKKIQETEQDAPPGATGRYSKAHDEVVANTKPISDYLDISEHGLIDTLVRPGGLGDTVPGLSAFINTFVEGQDYGSGTHNIGGTDKLYARVRVFRGETGQGGEILTGGPAPAYVNFGWAFTDEEVTARMRSGVNQAGDILGYAEFVRRTRMFQDRGNPWASDNVDDHLFEVLYRNGTISIGYSGESGLMAPDSFAPYVGQTLQQWLDVQQLVQGGGRGPSGNDDQPVRGPGVA